MKKEKKIKAWIVIHKLQKLGRNEQIDCFTSKEKATKHLQTFFRGEEELKIVPIEIIINLNKKSRGLPAN